MHDKPAEKSAEKASTEKLVLFNHSRNPYHLKNGANGETRIFAVGSSLECEDRAEYDFLKNYRGVTTTQQSAPGLHAHVQKLEADKAAALEEVAELKKQLEKFQSKGK
jgi:hypothetical protein